MARTHPVVADRAVRRNFLKAVPSPSTLLRDPLVHFLAIGALLFVVFDWLGARGEDVIAVDDAALVQFMRSRDPRLDTAAATTILGGLTRPGARR